MHIMLQVHTNRPLMTRATLALALGFAWLMGLPLSAQSASVTGRVVDQSGGTIPGATVTLTDAAGAVTRAVTNAAGKFTFGNLLAGRHELATTLPGFKTAKASVTLVDGQTVEPVVTLEVGAVTETVTVACSAPTYLDTLVRLLDGVMPTVHAQGASAPIRVRWVTRRSSSIARRAASTAAASGVPSFGTWECRCGDGSPPPWPRRPSAGFPFVIVICLPSFL